MGNNLDAYRAAIGLFRACKMSLNIGYFLILLILILHMDMDLSDKISTALNGALDM
jgi:hypothetical protein